MRPFTLERAADPVQAVQRAHSVAESHARAPVQYLAGGTTLLDLMKLDVMHPRRLVDLGPLQSRLGEMHSEPGGLHLGALVRMSAAADHPAMRGDYPVLAQALQQAASAQLRNMATLGGNVLQRTRCSYFRDPSWKECNKRTPGSGCAAIGGANRRLAILGVSDQCIAQYPGDFGTALIALGAEVDILGSDGTPRTINFDRLHRLPDDTPHIETSLQPGELITGFFVPAGGWTRRSLYLKIRDRSSYDFALLSAAVALDLAPDGRVRAARVGLGGVATKPWRSHEAETVLLGRILNEAAAREAAQAAFAAAITHGENDFKPELGRRTLTRALLEASALEI